MLWQPCAAETYTSSKLMDQTLGLRYTRHRERSAQMSETKKEQHSHQIMWS